MISTISLQGRDDYGTLWEVKALAGHMVSAKSGGVRVTTEPSNRALSPGPRPPSLADQVQPSLPWSVLLLGTWLQISMLCSGISPRLRRNEDSCEIVFRDPLITFALGKRIMLKETDFSRAWVPPWTQPQQLSMSCLVRTYQSSFKLKPSSVGTLASPSCLVCLWTQCPLTV